MRLILASASPARAAVLRAAGIEPVIEVSGVDEDALAASLHQPSPAELVTALAAAKADQVAERVADRHPDAVVVGCDSMLHVAGDTVGKPGTVETARQWWRRMAGGTAALVTGHAVVRLEGAAATRSAQGHASTTVSFAVPTEPELDAYLASGEPLQVAGAFTLDGLGGWFVEGVDGDPSNVIGISLPLTRRLLTAVGVPVTALWSPGPGH